MRKPFKTLFWLAALAGTLLLGIQIGKWSADRRESAGPAPQPVPAAGRTLWTCGMHPQVIQDHPGDCPICHMKLTPLRADSDAPAAAPKSTGGHAGPTVTIDPVITQNMGLRLGKVEKGQISNRIRVAGYLTEPEPLHRDINLRVSGWIEKLYANIDGMDVKAGEPLFDLFSPELRGAIEELLSARKAAQHQAGNQDSLRLLTEGAARKLELMGLTRRQVAELAALDQAPATVPILSPIDGHVTQKMVYEGSAVKAGDLALRIASRREMWLDAQVYESQLPLFGIGDPVSATVESQPGRTFDGKIVFIHPHLDPVTRTARVRAELPNHDLLLRQGMFATVEITPAARAEVTIVPREAVIDTGARHIVFVALGGGRFEPRLVRVGQSGEGMMQILSGLLPGETIVTSGQFLLDSESRLKEAIAKHLQDSLAGGAARAATQPAVNVPNLREIVQEYLRITRTLGEPQTLDRPLDLKPLVNAARVASQQGSAPARQLLQPVIAAAETMAPASLPDQRRLLLPLSEAMLALVDRAVPEPGMPPRLYVAQCPMALDDRGAVWLQDRDRIANPYFATSMKSCGEIVRAIDTGGNP